MMKTIQEEIELFNSKADSEDRLVGLGKISEEPLESINHAKKYFQPSDEMVKFNRSIEEMRNKNIHGGKIPEKHFKASRRDVELDEENRLMQNQLLKMQLAEAEARAAKANQDLQQQQGELKQAGDESATQAVAVGSDGAGSQAATQPQDPKLSKLEQQEAILKVINAKQFNPKAIPDGEKRTIQIICESDNPVLFKAGTAFDRAWKKGIGELWKMEYHEIYARRGNN